MDGRTSDRLYISIDTATVYWLEGDNIGFTPIMRDNTFDLEQGGVVDEEMMKGEHVYEPETNNYQTFDELYAHIRKELS